jgi:hypothetical protein
VGEIAPSTLDFLRISQVLDFEHAAARRVAISISTQAPDLNLEELFPFVRADMKISEMGLSVRSSNCLRREGIETYADLRPRSYLGLATIKNLGSSSHSEIFAVLFTENLFVALNAWSSFPEPKQLSSLNQSEGAEHSSSRVIERMKENNLSESVALISAWISVSGALQSFQIVQLENAFLDIATREKLDAAFKVLKKSLGLESGDVSPMFSSLESLGPIQRALILKRICFDGKTRLQNIADEFGVTRERVRQIEVATRSEFLNLAKSDPRIRYALGILKNRTNQVDLHTTVLDTFPSFASYGSLGGLTDLDILVGFDEDHWVFDGLISRIPSEVLITKIVKIARSNDSVGLLSLGKFKEILGEFFGDGSSCFDFGLTRELFSVRGNWIIPAKMGMIDLAFLALVVEKIPMDFDSLMEIALGGKSQRTLRNGLFSDPRFRRVSLTHWGLSSWSDGEYTSIKDHIFTLVSSSGGVRLGDLVSHLTVKYGVSASSVTAYAASWPFQTVGGIVYESETTLISYEGQISKQGDLFFLDGDLVLRMKIGPDHLRGSGSQLPKAAAVILNLNHGDAAEFRFHALDLNLKVNFNSSQPKIGSIRPLAQILGAGIGDQVFLRLGSKNSAIFRPANHELEIGDLQTIFESDIANFPPKKVLAFLVRILSLQPSDTFPIVFSTLRQRGELKLEKELRSLIGDNEAYGLEANSNKVSKYKISLIREGD